MVVFTHAKMYYNNYILCQMCTLLKNENLWIYVKPFFRCPKNIVIIITCSVASWQHKIHWKASYSMMCKLKKKKKYHNKLYFVYTNTQTFSKKKNCIL